MVPVIQYTVHTGLAPDRLNGPPSCPRNAAGYR
jgi:hypothetical protein